MSAGAALNAVIVELEESGAWTDVSADVLVSLGIELDRGIDGWGPRDRVAKIGTCKFSLMNHAGNSASLLGYYALGHSNKRASFAFGQRVRVRYVYGGTSYTRFVGRLAEIRTLPGQYLEGLTHCVAVGWMDEAARQKTVGLTTQTSKRSDQAFSSLLALASIQPPATEIGTGMDIYPYVFDNVDADTSLHAEFERLAASELGRIYEKADGTLVFEDRRALASISTNAVTFDNTMIALALSGTRDDIINRVRIRMHPRRIDAAAVVLFRLSEVSDDWGLAPSEQKSFYTDYTNPNNREESVGGTDMVTPVAVTDYTFNTARDGSGSDVTSTLGVEVTFYANYALVRLQNNGSQVAYVTELTLRGKGIYDGDEITVEAEDTTSQQTYGHHDAALDMPYQADQAIAQQAASYIVNVWKDPITQQVRSLTFQANASAALMAAALSLDISSRIGVKEAATGMTDEISGSPVTRGYFVNSVKERVTEGPWLEVTLGLMPADQLTSWVLEQTGRTELDLTARLSYDLFAQFWVLNRVSVSELEQTTKLAA